MLRALGPGTLADMSEHPDVRSPRRLRPVAVIGLSIAVAAAVVVALTGTSHGPDRTISLGDLTRKVGVYHLTDAGDVPAAAAIGAQLALAPDGGDTPLTQALSDHHMQYIDQTIQTLIYRAYCPEGQGTCRQPTPADSAAMLDAIKSHVQQVEGTHMVAAYYLLDDYYTDMGSGLRAAYEAIRSVDPNTPTICAFYQGLAYQDSSGTWVTPQRLFVKSLRNYSPQWCDAVAIYSYAPAFFAPIVPPVPIVEWDMRSTLPYVLATLKSKGWDPTRQPLIGMPGAFGYEPRTGRAWQGQFAQPEWRYAPTRDQLATQINAFCSAGAIAILPYVWNDGSPGTVEELFNSPRLEAGLTLGTQKCHDGAWAE